MASGVPPLDEERLPWLEPYRDPAVTDSPRKIRVALLLAAIAGVAIALIAGYYLGQVQKSTQPASVAPVTVTDAGDAQDNSAVPDPVAESPGAVGPVVAQDRFPLTGSAGRVVQTGAFRTHRRALAAYRAQVARHPDLTELPHIVVPVSSKPSGRILYALRLGTSSRQQSRNICRDIEAGGDQCLIIG